MSPLKKWQKIWKLTWTETLLLWYGENKRPFIWRQTKDPYKIWLSEVILQQTKTTQGLPYYERFTKTFPTIEALALASEEEVLKLWQGLGYYSRARNLHATAQYIVNELQGKFPSDFKSLLQLKGIGDYTASAIASICYNQAEAVVDGNVYRFLSRYFGILTPINSSAAHKEFKTKARSLMDATQAGNFNQALMEFGALQCTPKNPLCLSCPFVAKCVAFNQKKTYVLPVKKGKVKVRKRYFNYLVIQDQKHKTLVDKRLGKGIWQNLYQFPLIETAKASKNKKDIINQIPATIVEGLSTKKLTLWNKEPIVHLLSHQKLYVYFWILPSKKELKNGLTIEMLKKQAVPVVIQNFIEKFFQFDS